MGLNKNYANAMMPMVIGPQGDGKTQWAMRIIPPELRTYYNDRVDFSNRNEAEKALYHYLLINLDEYDSYTPRQMAGLKNLIQKQNIKQRKAYSSITESFQRYASFVATTNDDTPLTDQTGSRRFMCVESRELIDNTSPVNYDQMYAQMRAELQQGITYYFTHEDEAAIQQYNINFQVLDSMEEAFNELFRKPYRGEEGEKMTPTEMLTQIQERYPVFEMNKKNLQALGRMLKRKKVTLYRMHDQRRYMIMKR
jgi:predicted P-loop ATPase